MVLYDEFETMSENDTMKKSRRDVLGMIGAGGATSIFGTGVARGFSTNEETTTVVIQVTPYFEVAEKPSGAAQLRLTQRDDLRGISVLPEESTLLVANYATEGERDTLMNKDVVAMTHDSTVEFSGQVLESGILNELPIGVDSAGTATSLISPNGTRKTVAAGQEKSIEFFSNKVDASALKSEPTENGNPTHTRTEAAVSTKGGIVVRHLGEVTIKAE